MTQIDTDTICAIATASGRSGIGIVRVSGPLTRVIADKLLGYLPAPRKASFGEFYRENNAAIDSGIALFFPAPNSFTGEDVLELQGHGGPVVLTSVLNAVKQLGARLARPGEFSERSFLNNKMDLAQLEAVADLIDASTEQAARSAMRTLSGKFSELIHDLVEKITLLRVYIEAAIDFSDQEIDFLGEGNTKEKLVDIVASLDDVLTQARQGAILREGLNVVIAGEPNAGKSSLLNVLAGHESAIVTEIPGTTRDLLRELINIDGMPVHIIDTAGLRHSNDKVEQEGIRRARQAIDNADCVLLLIDSLAYDFSAASVKQHMITLGLTQTLAEGNKLTVVFSKIDLTPARPAPQIELPKEKLVLACVGVSAHSGEGIDILRQHLKKIAGYDATEEGSLAARRRHLDALAKAKQFLGSAQIQLLTGGHPELMAEDLRMAQQHLGEITGKFTSDDLLGKIFSSFCIGK